MKVEGLFMTALSQSVVADRSRSVTGHNGFVDRYFYFGMSLVIAAITVYGFSLTIDASLLHAAKPRPLLLWFHGAAFSAWIVFYIVQSALIRTHHVRLHRSLGWFGAVLGAVMVPLGVAIAVIMGRFHIHQLHEAASGYEAPLISPLYDMAAFGILLGLAVYWRRRPDLHRRLMLMATCGLTTAAIARFPIVAIQNDYNYVCVDSLILLGVARDVIVDHRVHKAYLYTLPVLVVIQSLMMYVDLSASAWWVPIAHAILG
jgi:hypothetical protein